MFLHEYFMKDWKTREITTEKSLDVGSKRPENFANFLQQSLNILEASWNSQHSALYDNQVA